MASRMIPAKTIYICDCCGEEVDEAFQIYLNVNQTGEVPMPLFRFSKDLCGSCYEDNVGGLCNSFAAMNFGD